VSTLSGLWDSDERNETIVTMGDNSLLDGFTVTDAADYGIYGSIADFTIENCTVIGNEEYGIRAIGGNVIIRWCFIQNNVDGIRHQGEGFTLTIENTQVRKNMRYGIFSQNSTPTIINSIVSESDLSEAGSAGIRMVNPTDSPVLHNTTIAHNKAEGISLVGSILPDVQNCIVYYNNGGGRQLAGFTADNAAYFSCIQDCNSVNFNISVEPQFAYFDPNNVRIAYVSPCRDAGNPLLSYDEQIDMDGKIRVYGAAVDIGAYEIDCEDVSNAMDWNADGIVNLYEFNFFSKAWLSHDPNDPAWRADPNLADPNLSEGWYDWKYRFNLDATSNSAYQVDLADLIVFAEEIPWLWQACWRTEFWPSEMMMSGIGERVLLGRSEMAFETQVIQEKSAQEQILDLANVIVQLEQIWLDEPDIQQTINADDWQRFIKAVYQSLFEIETESIQIEKMLDLTRPK
jgi:hypothetical protein